MASYISSVDVSSLAFVNTVISQLRELIAVDINTVSTTS